ncbi:hypothetical protein [Streptomyces sp. GSL17-111]|uniref:hypothetical protein n=1 Tax=Streptomyces sp. GSL17-111 TaxID=3121596 RepID=UPI0030F37B8E
MTIYLDEMVNLGLLIRLPGEERAYAMRSPNVVNMLGTQAELEMGEADRAAGDVDAAAADGIGGRVSAVRAVRPRRHRWLCRKRAHGVRLQKEEKVQGPQDGQAAAMNRLYRGDPVQQRVRGQRRASPGARGLVSSAVVSGEC